MCRVRKASVGVLLGFGSCDTDLEVGALNALDLPVIPMVRHQLLGAESRLEAMLLIHRPANLAYRRLYLRANLIQTVE